MKASRFRQIQGDVTGLAANPSGASRMFGGTLLTLLLSLLLIVGLAVAATVVFVPAKKLENFAMRHADKLPLAYFGEKLFDEYCSSCHDNPATHAPGREALSGFSKESIMIALEFGKMQPMASHLHKREKGLIAIYLAGSAPADEWVENHRCTITSTNRTDDDATVYVGNWGLGPHNRRHTPDAMAGISRDNVGSLSLAWSLAFPKVTDMRSQPAIVGDTLYFGDKTGGLFAIDRHTGCVRNHRTILSGVRSAITVIESENNRRQLIFADSMASIYAVDALSLKTLWQTDARLFDTSVITGSISYHDGLLYVPVSSYEVAVAGSPNYNCCSSHGGVLALNAMSGERIWEWHATPSAIQQGTNSSGQPLLGPSGASVWSTPTIDADRGRLYIGTGENLSHPATTTSDAVIALDLKTGELAWSFQATANDVWNAACLNNGANCPADAGGDFDFGASIVLASLSDGSQLLFAGQKSGDVYALNPDPEGSTGEIVWHRRVSNAAIGPNLHQTTTNGGIHWGMSVAGGRLLVAASDPERNRPEYIPKPGLHALQMHDGEILWHVGVTRGCDIPEEDKPLIGLQDMRTGKKIDLATKYRCSFYYGLSAALTSTDQLVFSAALDGKVRAFDVTSGERLWEATTAQPFSASNGVQGHGGAIDVSGQVIADGWLYVQSGYAMFGQLPGNMLLAYRIQE